MTMNRIDVDLSGLPKHLHRQLQWVNGSPVLFLDNSTESHSKDLQRWALLHGVVVYFARTSKPWHKMRELSISMPRAGKNCW
jgi:hypothetical protein